MVFASDRANNKNLNAVVWYFSVAAVQAYFSLHVHYRVGAEEEKLSTMSWGCEFKSRAFAATTAETPVKSPMKAIIVGVFVERWIKSFAFRTNIYFDQCGHARKVQQRVPHRHAGLQGVVGTLNARLH